jgi:hypothetical protein
LRRLVERGELGDRALLHYLDNAATFHSHFRQQSDAVQPGRIKVHANRVLRRFADRLRANDELWGKATYYLVTTHQYRKLARLCSDWRQRKGVEGWMLYNLATGFQLANRPGEAREVVRYARGLRLDRELFHALAVRDAFEVALAGDPSGARDILDQVDDGQLRSIDQQILVYARALTESPAPGADRREAGKAIRQALAAGAGGPRPYFMHAIIARYYWRTVRRLTAAHPSFGLRIWAWWNFFGPSGLALPALGLFPALGLAGVALQQAPLVVIGATGTLLSALLLKR